jgi:hypothetical protein
VALDTHWHQSITFDLEELEAALGEPYTNKVVARLRSFAHIPQAILGSLADLALAENWGDNKYALEKYLSVQIAWSFEQRKISTAENQLYVTAGNLQTRYGTPIYLVFEKNSNPGRQPLYCVHVGSDISAPELPIPPDIPSTPDLPRGVEVVMLHDHILKDNEDRVPFLGQTPPVSQMCAIAGAIQWSINRGLQLPYWYFGKMNYLVPLYMQSREDITQAPDLIAPIQASPDMLLVRTVFLPHMPYANARVSVRRHDQLPNWLLDAWNRHADATTTSEIDDPEEVASAGRNGH